METKTVATELVMHRGERYLIALMPSDSTPGKVYRTDVTNGRCSCPAWKFSKKGVDGNRPPCKHLRELGFTSLKEGPPEEKPVKKKGPWFHYNPQNL